MVSAHIHVFLGIVRLNRSGGFQLFLLLNTLRTEVVFSQCLTHSSSLGTDFWESVFLFRFLFSGVAENTFLFTCISKITFHII